MQQLETVASFERKQLMQLKIIHTKMKEDSSDDFTESEQQKIVMVDRKADTYESLKTKAMAEFFGEGKADSELFRLRAYNVQFKILMDTYEGREDLTLELLKIYPMKTLALEERPSKDRAW